MSICHFHIFLGNMDHTAARWSSSGIMKEKKGMTICWSHSVTVTVTTTAVFHPCSSWCLAYASLKNFVCLCHYAFNYNCDYAALASSNFVVCSWCVMELRPFILLAVEGADPDRRDRLVELLDIDLRWRMHKVSDGQRRRVQICMGLLHPYKVLWNYSAFHFSFKIAWTFLSLRCTQYCGSNFHLMLYDFTTDTFNWKQVLLLDEVTVDLDVVTRMDLLDFFKEECEQVFIHFICLRSETQWIWLQV